MIPKVKLAQLPTPAHRLQRLSEELGGPELWIKRDDLTGLAMGGNKVRKLEYLLAEAVAQDADTLITAGAAQSNHCRQTAGAAGRVGMHCVLVLGGDDPGTRPGNLLLDELLGAEIVWAGEAGLNDAMQAEFDRLAADGRRPHLIPIGGSNARGAAAYAYATRELMEQDLRPDRIVVASSSGGTLAGLLAGARLFGYTGQITGIRIAKFGGAERDRLVELAKGVGELIGENLDISPQAVDIREGYMDAGYGIVTDRERDAIDRFARLEGILLDPVYTARAAAGMLDLIHRGEISKDERVLFWHTGGAPALFAYGSQVMDQPGAMS